MKKITVLLSMLILALKIQGLYAQQPNDGPFEAVYGLAIDTKTSDKNGRVRALGENDYIVQFTFKTGGTSDSITIGNMKIPGSTGTYNGAIARVTNGVTQWIIRLANSNTGINIDDIQIKSEAQGPYTVPYIYIVGGFSGVINFNPLGADSTYDNGSNFTGFIAKYNANNGLLVWKRVIPDNGYITTLSSEYNNDTLMALAGVFTNSLNIDNFSLTSTSSLQYFGRRSIYFGVFSTNNGKFKWIRKIDGGNTYEYRPFYIEYSQVFNKIVIGGYHGGNSTFEGSQSSISSYPNIANIFCAVYSADSGVYQTAKQFYGDYTIYNHTDPKFLIEGSTLLMGLSVGSYAGGYITIDTLSNTFSSYVDAKSYIFSMNIINGSVYHIHTFDSDDLFIQGLVIGPTGLVVMGRVINSSLNFAGKTLTGPQSFFATFNGRYQPCLLQSLKGQSSILTSSRNKSYSSLNTGYGYFLYTAGSIDNFSSANFGTKTDLNLNAGSGTIACVNYKLPQFYAETSYFNNGNKNILNMWGLYPLGTTQVNQNISGQIQFKNLHSNPVDTLYFCDVNNIDFINNMGFTANIPVRKFAPGDSVNVNVSITPTFIGTSNSTDIRIHSALGMISFKLGVTSDPTTSQTGINPSSLLLYPNPTSKSLMIKCETCNYGVSYSIKDNLGRKVLQGTLNQNHEIQVENLPSGVYFIELQNGLDIYQSKFIKD